MHRNDYLSLLAGTYGASEVNMMVDDGEVNMMVDDGVVNAAAATTAITISLNYVEACVRRTLLTFTVSIILRKRPGLKAEGHIHKSYPQITGKIDNFNKNTKDIDDQFKDLV